MKPTKPFSMLGTCIGIALWASLAYVFYPHWSAWVFGVLMVLNAFVLLKQGVKAS